MENITCWTRIVFGLYLKGYCGTLVSPKYRAIVKNSFGCYFWKLISKFPFSCRWFDKSFSLIVTGDGVAGINFEHSWGDGVAVLRFFQDIYAETTNRPFVHPDSKPANTVVSVKKLGNMFCLYDKFFSGLIDYLWSSKCGLINKNYGVNKFYIIQSWFHSVILQLQQSTFNNVQILWIFVYKFWIKLV